MKPDLWINEIARKSCPDLDVPEREMEPFSKFALANSLLDHCFETTFQGCGSTPSQSCLSIGRRNLEEGAIIDFCTREIERKYATQNSAYESHPRRGS